MDVWTKVHLMNEYDSYWDMLPPEIQEYILRLRANQLCYEKTQNETWQRLLREIRYYTRLKERWGLGHIQCVPRKRLCDACQRHHVRIFGHYVNQNNAQRRRFLGSGMLNALNADIHHIKATL